MTENKSCNKQIENELDKKDVKIAMKYQIGMARKWDWLLGKKMAVMTCKMKVLLENRLKNESYLKINPNSDRKQA